MKFFQSGLGRTRKNVWPQTRTPVFWNFTRRLLLTPSSGFTDHTRPKDEGCTLNRTVGAYLPDDTASILEELNLHQQPFYNFTSRVSQSNFNLPSPQCSSLIPLYNFRITKAIYSVSYLYSSHLLIKAENAEMWIILCFINARISVANWKFRTVLMTMLATLSSTSTRQMFSETAIKNSSPYINLSCRQ